MTNELENKLESLEIENGTIGETPNEVEKTIETSEKTSEISEIKDQETIKNSPAEENKSEEKEVVVRAPIYPPPYVFEKKEELVESTEIPEEKIEEIVVEKVVAEKVVAEQKDYSQFTREEAIEELRTLIHETNVDDSRKDIETLKNHFYKKQKLEYDDIRKQLQEQAGEDGEIKMPKDTLEDYLKELMADYKKKKSELAQEQEKEKEKNLALKNEVIEKIKGLANSEESLNVTFNEFKQLQQEWGKIGSVPSSEANTLWKNYQLQIERFYDLVKINKELRDLDFKKNLDKKIQLCEKAEELLLKTDIVATYKDLQKLHEIWKEYGPVPSDKREEVWDRFSITTKKIRQSYQDHFEKQKEERNANYEQKIILCEKAEEIAQTEAPKNGKEWGDVSNSVLELQKVWKTIGMVPKEVNTEIYERFRAACNKFFEAKKEYFDVINADLNENYQKKLDLCVSAESMQDNTEWKKTTEMFFDLQKKWKDIGAVPRKSSDQIWKRFRAACDHFFNTKSNFYKNIDQEHKDNLVKKEDLIKEINSFEASKDQKENISKIKEFQTRWTEIGYVANSQKDRLYKEYKSSVNDIYDKLNLSKNSLDASNFNSRVEVMKETGEINGLQKERSKILRQIQELNSEINQIENNMGFFSSGSGSIIKDFQKKIDNAQDQVKALKDKKKAIDLAEREIKNKDKKDEQND